MKFHEDFETLVSVDKIFPKDGHRNDSIKLKKELHVFTNIRVTFVGWLEKNKLCWSSKSKIR